MNVDRLLYTVRGAAAYALNNNVEHNRDRLQQPGVTKPGPHVVFTFWDVPGYTQTVDLMMDLKKRFEGGGLPIGVGLFTRPMGDVREDADFSYDPTKLRYFLHLAKYTQTPVFINTSGMQWTEVAAPKSPLLRKLDADPNNRMLFQDGTPVPRKLQPPSDTLEKYMLDGLAGRFGTDGNGVLYLSPHAPRVRKYRERNLAQMAEAIAPFARENPELFLGISTENEVDYPGEWAAGKDNKGPVDYSWHATKAFRDEYTHLGMDGFKQLTVSRVLEKNVQIYQDAGLPNIYTNQSSEDASRRASPIESADVKGSNIGITTWGTGNKLSYARAEHLAFLADKKWALVVSNPYSLNVEENKQEIQDALNCKPSFVGIYNWWPHFWGYGVRGMPLAKAIQSFTK